MIGPRIDRAITYAPSVAQRKIPMRKRGSRTGFKMDPFQRRKVWFESGLESWWLQVLIAHPHVHEIREQQLLTIPFQGRMVKHYFDFVVVWKDGSTSAMAVKYQKDCEGLPQLLRASPPTFSPRMRTTGSWPNSAWRPAKQQGHHQ